ncbi:MAG TPA: cupin domain-containing protein [Methanoregulaceae archaeon]|nr:cupin domain-containing protein [Methanoregulaceae archaeon]
MTEFILERNANLPQHSHPHEQTGYLVKGHITLTIGDEDFDVLPGDSWNIPCNTRHLAKIHENSIAIEIFYPVRKDYLPTE